MCQVGVRVAINAQFQRATWSEPPGEAWLVCKRIWMHKTASQPFLKKKTHTTAGYTSVSVAVPRCGCPWDSVCHCLCCYLCVCLLFFSVCLFLCLLFISLAPFVIDTALRTAHKYSLVSLWLMQISRPLKSKAPCHTPPQLFQATNPEQQSRDTSLSLACLFCSRQSTSYQAFF